MSSDTYFEIINIEEFAKRMNVCTGTVHKWKRDMLLVPGEHYFKYKRVLLFMWCKEIIKDVFNKSKEETTDTDPVIKLPPVRKKGNSSMKINLDYRSKGNHGKFKERSKKAATN